MICVQVSVIDEDLDAETNHGGPTNGRENGKGSVPASDDPSRRYRDAPKPLEGSGAL
jgi:hypothetical protein